MEAVRCVPKKKTSFTQIWQRAKSACERLPGAAFVQRRSVFPSQCNSNKYFVLCFYQVCTDKRAVGVAQCLGSIKYYLLQIDTHDTGSVSGVCSVGGHGRRKNAENNPKTGRGIQKIHLKHLPCTAVPIKNTLKNRMQLADVLLDTGLPITFFLLARRP